MNSISCDCISSDLVLQIVFIVRSTLQRFLQKQAMANDIGFPNSLYTLGMLESSYKEVTCMTLQKNVLVLSNLTILRW
jgi:hypothetical protein